MPEQPIDDILTELRGRIGSAVAEGFDTRDQIIENMTEYAVEEYGRDDFAGTISRITDELLRDHAREESRWEGQTDCDRLDAAFEGLNRDGVVARQHFT